MHIDKTAFSKYNILGDMMKSYDCILFDFDGTLSDSALGVRRCIELTLQEMGRPSPDLSDFSKYVGPPLTRTFHKLCGLSYEESFLALPIYRKHYNEAGIYENRMYDGIEELLQALKESGRKLAVCTSKNEHLALKSMEIIGALPYFDAVCGSLDDGTRKEKRDLIPYALQALGCKDKKKAVMIGDTRFDAAGASDCQTDFIGVLYGYGSEMSMREAGAKTFADSPAALLSLLT